MPPDKPTPCSPMYHPVGDPRDPLEHWPILQPVKQESSRERFEREYLGKVMGDKPRPKAPVLAAAYDRGYEQALRDAETRRAPAISAMASSSPPPLLEQGRAEHFDRLDPARSFADLWPVASALSSAVCERAITEDVAEQLWLTMQDQRRLVLDPLVLRTALVAFSFSLEERVIRGEMGPYLSRYTVAQRRDGGAIYLHCFHRSDADRELHNHPWSGAAHVLVGGYREERRGADGRIVTTEYRPGDVNTIAPDTFHRVDLLEPETWTLFFAGPRVQDWGFWSRDLDVFTPWREAFARRGLL